ncbi:hypothetical protein GZL_07269 [Streptomyces sp. 769]|nr:hypothetical protein GZL_07269 [Streptomyces sp. 769]
MRTWPDPDNAGTSVSQVAGLGYLGILAGPANHEAFGGLTTCPSPTDTSNTFIRTS